MDVRDAVASRHHQLDRVAAADHGLAGAEADAHDARVGRVQERQDLLGALDVGADVRMEGRRDAARVRALRPALDPLRRASEVAAAQRRLAQCVDAAGCGEPELVRIAGEDDGAGASRLDEDVDRRVEGGEVGEEPVLVRDAQKREGTGELEAVMLECVRDVPRARTEVTGLAELDGRVAEVTHQLEHAVRRIQIVPADGPLPDTPRARRAREPANAHARNRRSSPRASS
jgi:hypothetical protein